MLSKHWDHPSVYNMIMKLLITRGPITLIRKEATKTNHLEYQCAKLYNDKQLIFLQEGSNKILSRESKSFVSCSHMNCCLQEHTTYQFTKFYLLFISRQVQEFKNYQNPSSTSKDTYKTIFIILFNLFHICNAI